MTWLEHLLVRLLAWVKTRQSPTEDSDVSEVLSIVPIELPCFDWSREYRELWDQSPSAFWLRPEPEDVRRLLKSLLDMGGREAEIARRLEPVLTREEVSFEDEELFFRLVADVSKLSRQLEQRSLRRYP